MEAIVPPGLLRREVPNMTTLKTAKIISKKIAMTVRPVIYLINYLSFLEIS